MFARKKTSPFFLFCPHLQGEGYVDLTKVQLINSFFFLFRRLLWHLHRCSLGKKMRVGQSDPPLPQIAGAWKWQVCHSRLGAKRMDGWNRGSLPGIAMESPNSAGFLGGIHGYPLTKKTYEHEWNTRRSSWLKHVESMYVESCAKNIAV